MAGLEPLADGERLLDGRGRVRISPESLKHLRLQLEGAR